VAITIFGALVWQVAERLRQNQEALHREVVARITVEAKAEMARISGEANAEMARITGEAKAEMARLQDKDQSCRFFLQVFGTHDHEPLEEALFKMHNK